MGEVLEVLKIQIFFGVLDYPDTFWVNGRCWVQVYV